MFVFISHTSSTVGSRQNCPFSNVYQPFTFTVNGETFCAIHLIKRSRVKNGELCKSKGGTLPQPKSNLGQGFITFMCCLWAYECVKLTLLTQKIEAGSFVGHFLTYLKKIKDKMIFLTQYQNGAYFYLDMMYDAGTGRFLSSYFINL